MMSESGEAEHHSGEKAKTRDVVWEDSGSIEIKTDRAEEKDVGVVSVVRGNRERKAGSFVKKRMRDSLDVDKFLENHKALKAAGFPVLPTLRKLDEDTVLVTDLSLGGKNKVFSINELLRSKQPEVEIENMGELKERLDGLVELADENDFVVLKNAYFVVVDEKGEGSLLLGSYGGNVMTSTEDVDRYKNDKSEYMKQYQREGRTVNRVHADGFWDLVEVYY